MKTIGILLIWFCLTLAGIHGVYLREAPKKYCTDERDPDFRLLVGQQGASPKGSCMLVKCEGLDADGKSILTAIGCGVFVASPGCKPTDYDNTKHYPDCCPSETC